MMVGSNIRLSSVFLVMISLNRQVWVDHGKDDDVACDDPVEDDEDDSWWMGADEVDDDEDDGQQHYAVKGLPCDDICEQVLVCEAKWWQDQSSVAASTCQQ